MVGVLYKYTNTVWKTVVQGKLPRLSGFRLCEIADQPELMRIDCVFGFMFCSRQQQGDYWDLQSAGRAVRARDARETTPFEIFVRGNYSARSRVWASFLGFARLHRKVLRFSRGYQDVVFLGFGCHR